MARRLNPRLVVGLFCVATAAFTPRPARADDKIRVLNPTPFSENSDIPDAVKEQCRDIGRELAPAISRSNRDVVMVKTEKELTAKTGKYFKIEIVEVRAKGGGVFTGPKHMSVRGVLYDGGKEIADVEVRRGSTMAFSACSSLEKVEKTLGKDLAGWLRNPKKGDQLN